VTPAPIGFVAGATGFVGRAVVAALVARGVRTVAHVRPDSKRLDHWRDHFAAAGAEVDTTGWQTEAMSQRLAALVPSHVFCLIGTTRDRARADRVEGDIYEAVDVGLTRIVAAAAAAVEPRPRLVYLSSVGASPSSRSAYLRARARAEEAVREAGVPWAIARPSFISGPGRDDTRPGERMAAGVSDAALAVVGLLGGRKLRDRYRSTTPDRLAGALVHLALDVDAQRVFEAGDLRAAATGKPG